MSQTHTIRLAPSPGASRLQRRMSPVVAAIVAARQRWIEADRVHAQNAAIRGLDRRTRQDLGLYAGDEPWSGRSGPLAAEYERLRW